MTSPTIMLITLAGLEEAVIKTAPIKYSRINVIAYADDFVITGASKEILKNKVKPVVCKFLAERGLTLSEEKTKITHIQEGFDFLGFNIRKYKQKLLIKPAKQNVLGYLRKIWEVIRKSGAATTGKLIEILNPKIRGWRNYYRHCVAKRTFNYIDHNIYKAIIRWCQRKHPNTGNPWIVEKYFSKIGNNRWKFTGIKKLAQNKTKHLVLESMSQIPIHRYKKIIGKANPYDPSYAEYFKRRKIENLRNTWNTMPITA